MHILLCFGAAFSCVSITEDDVKDALHKSKIVAEAMGAGEYRLTDTFGTEISTFYITQHQQQDIPPAAVAVDSSIPEFPQVDVGDDSLVHAYLIQRLKLIDGRYQQEEGLTKIIKGEYRLRLIKMGKGIDSWYELFPIDASGWTRDVLTFQFKEQMENFGRILQIKLAAKPYNGE